MNWVDDQVTSHYLKQCQLVFVLSFRTNFIEILIWSWQFSFKKMPLKMLSTYCQPILSFWCVVCSQKTVFIGQWTFDISVFFFLQGTDNKETLACSRYDLPSTFVTGIVIILCMHPANERWRYNVTSSLNGWTHTQNDPYWHGRR